jgi:hypothetical protein
MNLCQVQQEFGWFCRSGRGPWIVGVFFNVFSIVVSGCNVHPQLKKILPNFVKKNEIQIAKGMQNDNLCDLKYQLPES